MRPVLYQLTPSLRNGCYSLCNLPSWLPRSKITANLCPVWGHYPSEGLLGPCAWKLPFVPDPMEGEGVKKFQIRSQKHTSGRTSWFKRQAPRQNSSALVEGTEGHATAGLKLVDIQPVEREVGNFRYERKNRKRLGHPETGRQYLHV